MNKQLVNLIGGAASVAILLLGILVFALPQFSQANSVGASADDVAANNRTQQTVLDTLTAQAADMTELEDAVAELRAEIPEGRYVDDILLLAVNAAVANGGTTTTITPATPEAFAPRTAEAAAAAESGTAAPEPTTDGSTDTGTTDADTAGTDAAATDAAATAASGDAASGDAAAAADAAQQIAVTVVIDAPDVAAATRILDDLRAGPRLVAVTQASVTTDPEKGATLTATLLAFFRP